MHALNSYEHLTNDEEELRDTAGSEHKEDSATGKHRHVAERSSLFELAELELRRREDRSRHLPHEFTGDAPWGILLILFTGEQRATTRSVADICGASVISKNIVIRWLQALGQAGFIGRETGCEDPSFGCVYLTDKGRDAVTSILNCQLSCEPAGERRKGTWWAGGRK